MKYEAKNSNFEKILAPANDFNQACKSYFLLILLEPTLRLKSWAEIHQNLNSTNLVFNWRDAKSTPC